MKKNGFTLVELLAVIAILAILVIIALPNVMQMFNDAKKNSFMTEVKQILKTAEQQWMSESMFDTNEKEYSRCSSGCSNPLPLSGRKEINYYIKLNKSGKVVEYYVSDGTYQYRYSGNELNVENIDSVEEIAKLGTDQIIDINTIVVGGGNNSQTYYCYDTQEIGHNIDTNNIFNSFDECTSSFGHNYCLKVTTNNDIVQKIYVVFKFSGNQYEILGGSSYQSNKDYITSIFGSSSCEEITGTYPGYMCGNESAIVRVYENDFVSVTGGRFYCSINYPYSAYCSDD